MGDRNRGLYWKRLLPKRCERCGVVQRGEFNQMRTCRNTETCKRRVLRNACTEVTITRGDT